MSITIKIEVDGREVVNQKVEDTVKTESGSYSQYARFFDETSPYWTKDSEYNVFYLLAQQNYANEKLKAHGHLFLNDVYEMLGIPKSKAGQVVGWIYDKKNPFADSYVDFGIYKTDKNAKFVNGFEKTILLDFNVDGAIIDKI